MPKGVPNRRHTGEFKQQVIEDMRNNSLSLSEIAAKYGVSRSVMRVWERIYLEEGVKGLYVERRGRSCAADGVSKGRPPKLDKKVEEDLIAENQRLRLENEYLKKLQALVQQEERQTSRNRR